MDSQALRDLQSPIKARYRVDAAAADFRGTLGVDKQASVGFAGAA